MPFPVIYVSNSNFASKQHPAKDSALQRPQLPSKGHWTGELLIDNRDNTERICDVSLTETVDKDVGFTFRNQLRGKDSIRFSKCYTRWEVSKILRALKGVDRTAKVFCKSEGNKNAFMTFSRYMEQRNLVGTVFYFLHH